MKNLFRIPKRFFNVKVTMSSLKETATGIKNMNRIIEFDPNLTKEQK